MKTYRFYEEQELHISIEEAWKFFSSPKNLVKITPPQMRFLITNNPGENIYSGMIITYKIRPLLNFPFNWVTEITSSEKPYFFIDDQRFGPYKFWNHRHTFKEVREGVLMKDEVHYALPLGILGRVIHSLIVKKKIREIFQYRGEALKKIFPDKTLIKGG